MEMKKRPKDDWAIGIDDTALVVIAFIINVLMGHSELKTLEGTMQVSLALETKITITAVLMIALVIAFFIRRFWFIRF